MKKVLCILLCLVCVLSFAACRSDAELKQEKEWKDLADDVMVDFLKNKYDIDVVVSNLRVCVDRDSNFVPIDSAPLIPYVTAQFNHGGNIYYICADLTDENNPICYDNFQEEEVQQIVVDHINQIVGSEAIAWYIDVYDRFEECYHVDDRLGSNGKLINKKITDFNDIIANTRASFEQKNYTYSNITVYYNNAGPIKLSDKDVQDFLKASEITIVNLSTANTALQYHGQAVGIDLFRDEIIEYVSIGNCVHHFVAGGEVVVYDLDNAITVDNFMFCSINDDIVPEILDTSDMAGVTKTFTVGNYTCIIPVNALEGGAGSVQGYEAVFIADNAEVKTVRGYDCLSTFSKDGAKYFIFNSASAEYAKYDAWYLRAIIN